MKFVNKFNRLNSYFHLNDNTLTINVVALISERTILPQQISLNQQGSDVDLSTKHPQPTRRPAVNVCVDSQRDFNRAS